MDNASPIRVLAMDEDSIEIAIDRPIEVVNGIRRSVLQYVQTLAIRSVLSNGDGPTEVSQATIARLGLLPIYSMIVADSPLAARHGGRMPHRTQCGCTSICDACTVVFKLDVCAPVACAACTGPCVHASSMTVYARDLVCVSAHADLPDGPRIVTPDVPICTLQPGESLALECHAHVASALEHAGHAAVVHAIPLHQRHAVDVVRDVEDLITPRQRAFIADACSARAITFDLETQRIVVCDAAACIGCGDCARIAIDTVRHGRRMQVNPMRMVPSNTYVLRVETLGTLSPERVISEALRELRVRVGAIRDEMRSIVLDEQIAALDTMPQGQFSPDDVTAVAMQWSMAE